jgi:hypothetical protein
LGWVTYGSSRSILVGLGNLRLLQVNKTLFDLQIKFILPDPDFDFQRKEGGINEEWNSQHDGGTEGCTRRTVALMKGGTMTALGNTARGSMVG